MLNRREALKGAVAAISLIALPASSIAEFAITPSHTVKGIFLGNDAFIPEMWVRESLTSLEESMVMSNIVHRDFTEQLAHWRGQLRQYNDQIET